jgi:hypothetical protein
MILKGTMMSKSAIKDTIKKHAGELMNIQGVVGVAEGRSQGRPCILVFVQKKTKELRSKVPKSLEGFPIRMEQSGDIEARNIDLRRI